MVVAVRNTCHSFHTPGIGFGSKPLKYGPPREIKLAASTPKPAIPSFFHANSTNGPVLATAKESLTSGPIHTPSGGFNRTLRNESRGSAKTNSLPLRVVSASRQPIKKHKVARSAPTRHENVVLLPVQKTVAVLKSATKHVSRQTFHFLEVVEESHRQATKEKRISQCLLGLRAASERSIDIQSYVSERSEPSRLKAMVGDVGLALFSPLDPEAFERLHNDDDDDDDSTLSELPEDHIMYPVDLEVETLRALASCPRLLTPSMIQQFIDQALPPAVKLMRWKRIFALGRDGDSFLTMLDHCKSYANTIIVLETSKGDLIGGFATSPWTAGGGKSSRAGFYGNGQCFLFSSHSKDTTHNDPLCIYKWTGKNTYSQICDDGQLAMGGEGAFGLIVNDNFSRGTTGRCSTFGNEPLVPDLGGTFEIVDFEVYGFTSMAESYLESPLHAHQLKPESLLADAQFLI